MSNFSIIKDHLWNCPSYHFPNLKGGPNTGICCSQFTVLPLYSEDLTNSFQKSVVKMSPNSRKLSETMINIIPDWWGPFSGCYFFLNKSFFLPALLCFGCHSPYWLYHSFWTKSIQQVGHSKHLDNHLTDVSRKTYYMRAQWQCQTHSGEGSSD